MSESEHTSSARAPSPEVPYVFILSWERPLYLWACLDALHRNTQQKCRFVLADNASRDPLVREVIRGFERRGLFEAVHLEASNDPRRIPRLIAGYRSHLGSRFAYIESDTVVPDVSPCWLTRMLAHMDAHQDLGMVGSVVDPRDFVAIGRARALHPELPDAEVEFLIKARAPMRAFRPGPSQLVEPHNPPGRLLLFRTEAYWQTGFDVDAIMHRAMKQWGWQSKIAADVMHRHLSLLNVYDYPHYGRKERDAFFQALSESPSGDAEL